MEENPETGGDRLPFEFVGTISTPLSIDPREYSNMTLPAITDALKKQLSEINPAATYFEDDLVLAANAIAGGNGDNPE